MYSSNGRPLFAALGFIPPEHYSRLVGCALEPSRRVHRQLFEASRFAEEKVSARLRTLSADDLDSLDEVLLDFKDLCDREQRLALNLRN